ncbi:MAG: c-type cytochrome [Ignavibacteriales bacterium]|nr:c-type cytochrome [Ignavibacteriales bacterium]
MTLSMLLFLGTMWAVVDEISTRRPWKETQEQYFVLSQQKWEEKLKESISGLDSATLTQVNGELKEAEEKLNSPEVVGLQKEVMTLEETLLDANRDYTFAKSRGDEAYYFWKKSIHEGKEDLGYKRQVQELTAQMANYNTRVEQLTARHDSLNKIVNGYRNAIKAVRSKVKDLYASIDLATSKIEKAKASSIQIRQVMMNNFDRSNFGIPKARIDRCQTCHLGWKDDLMEDVPQPYTMHPVPELLKIHNPEVFGCTPCHRGQGPGLTAGMAHGNEDRYWEWPLLKGKEVYASCNSCHTDQSYVKFADRFNKGKQILSEAGCFGCHEIKGFTDLAKIGPELNQLGAKTKAEWLFRWIRNPKDYNPHTRMPNFRFNDDQAGAIVAYLWSVSKDASYHLQHGISAGGNAAHGKELVETIGCKGCHVVGDDTRMRQERGFSYDVAPELTRAGSKLDPDWMFEWIKNPRQYRPTTRMPNLRLTDQEARDVVAYLVTLKDDRQFEQKKIALDNIDLIKRGDKLIREFGCSGCHTIKGMEKEGRVSVALSNIGRKRVDEIDFGDTKVLHNWDDWIFGKIQDARQYATDRIVSKMPVFAFSDSEIITLRTLLRGMTKEGAEEQYHQPFDKTLQAVETGRRVTQYYNCINCHKIEEIGGSIKATLDDEAMAPPYLFPEGSKVQEPWLHDFLKGPMPIRPWLKIRMPTFSLNDSEITTISKYFLALHKKDLELRDYRAFQPDQKYVSVGKKLFEDLQCLSCHYTGKIPEGKSFADLAPNLAMAKGRLKPDWILDWVADPQSIQPGTKMPQFYPDLKEPSPFSQDFGGDAKEQIKALRDYVLTVAKSK